MKLLHRKLACYFTSIFAIAAILPQIIIADTPKPFGAVPNARQIEWFHRKQQVFIHFGINTFTISLTKSVAKIAMISTLHQCLGPC